MLYYSPFCTTPCDDRDAVVAQVKKDGSALRFVSDRLLDDREIIQLAIPTLDFPLCLASNRLKDDYELVKEAVTVNGRSLYDASSRLKEDQGLFDLALENVIWRMTWDQENDEKLWETRAAYNDPEEYLREFLLDRA